MLAPTPARKTPASQLHWFCLTMLRQQLLDTSRGRIVTVLRAGGLTADDVAGKLKLTASAVRAQLSGMERDGVVRRVGQRPGTTRPSQVFELTREVEQLLSQAYVPLLTQIVGVFTRGLPANTVDRLIREAGQELAKELIGVTRKSASLQTRVARASKLMNEQLGAVTHVEANGGYVIRGAACPLAALTGKHPAVCLAMESFVSEAIGVPARECCDRTERPRCCFEIAVRPAAQEP
jgi:DeoR family transcriptional regulator, suf operon transcriptional repressor